MRKPSTPELKLPSRERFPFPPDYGAQLESQPRVRKVQFGDGYAQHAEDGARGRLQRWSVQFTARKKTEADALDAFLSAHCGVAAFEFVVPASEWAVTGFRFGTADGARTQYFLQRPLSPDVPGELVPATGWGAAPLVYRDGVLAAGTGYVLSISGLITFTASGAQVLRVVCERWTSVLKGFNAYDVSAEFEEVAG